MKSEHLKQQLHIKIEVSYFQCRQQDNYYLEKLIKQDEIFLSFLIHLSRISFLWYADAISQLCQKK